MGWRPNMPTIVPSELGSPGIYQKTIVIFVILLTVLPQILFKTRLSSQSYNCIFHTSIDVMYDITAII